MAPKLKKYIMKAIALLRFEKADDAFETEYTVNSALQLAPEEVMKWEQAREAAHMAQRAREQKIREDAR